jgi:hypothetical protein
LRGGWLAQATVLALRAVHGHRQIRALFGHDVGIALVFPSRGDGMKTPHLLRWLVLAVLLMLAAGIGLSWAPERSVESLKAR